jgi:predicted transcriptional regulator
MKKQEKKQSLILRRKGYSIKEIADLLNVSKSTVSIWVRKVFLNDMAIERLQKRRLYGRIKSVKIKKINKDKLLFDINKRVTPIIKSFDESLSSNKLICSLLYWCEGEKNDYSVRFINSDPVMASTFLYLFRNGFCLDEKKFRICLHLHDYHNEKEQKRFWSVLTKIPLSQFSKVYIKPHTGKNKKKGYPGCASIRYNDCKIALELKMIWELFGKKYGRVG